MARTNAIEMVSQARALLERANTPAEWLGIIRMAGAAKAFLRGRDEAHGAWIAAGEIVVRAKKRLADYVAEQPKARGAEGSPLPPAERGSLGDPHSPPTLADLGIPKGKVAQEYRALAKVQIDELEARLEAIREADTAPTVAAVLAAPSVSNAADYDGDSWCTPKEWIDLARAVMGSIDVDPATNAYGQSVVQATRSFTKADNGLAQDWGGNVWLNPPYSMPLIEQFAGRVLERDFDQAIVLVNNCTDAKWWHDLSLEASVTAFTRGRIAFEHPKTGVAFATRQGQTLFYFGDRSELFADTFAVKCACFVRVT